MKTNTCRENLHLKSFPNKLGKERRKDWLITTLVMYKKVGKLLHNIKVTGCRFVCVFAPKDHTNCWTDIVFLSNEVS